MKICAICKQEKPPEDFAKSTQRKDGRGSYCKPCDNERKARWKAKDPDAVRKYHNEYRKQWVKDNRDKERQYQRRTDLKRKFGLTLEEYEALLEVQGGVCAICERPERYADPRTGHIRYLAVDHCHDSNEIRGLLCSYCNLGLGQLGDTEESLMKAVEYLRKSKC